MNKQIIKPIYAIDRVEEYHNVNVAIFVNKEEAEKHKKYLEDNSTKDAKYIIRIIN